MLECENGVEALSIWKDRGADISLIVTDVVMPQMGGRELVRSLRRDGATVPILFISGYAEGTSPAKADDTGRSLFLAKPFDIGVLTRLVAELIHASNATAKASA